MPYARGSNIGTNVREGNIEKVECSDWATPVLPVMKPDEYVETTR